MPLKTKVNEFLDVIYDFATVSAEQWSCLEIEGLASLYREVGRSEEARRIIQAHSNTDEEGDDHYTGDKDDE